MGYFLFDFYWLHHRICHRQFWNIWRVILMTSNQHSLKSSKIKGHGANRKPIGGFPFYLHFVQHCIFHPY